MDNAPLPRLLTWAARLADPDSASFEGSVEEAAANGYEAGVVQDFERKVAGSETDMLQWSLAYSHYSWPLPGDGLVPFLINWEPDSLKRVNDSAASAGVCRFVEFEAFHKDPDEVNEILVKLGRVSELHSVQKGEESRLMCVLETPNGIVKV